MQCALRFMINRRTCLGEHARGCSETAERRSTMRGHAVQRLPSSLDGPSAPPPPPFNKNCCHTNYFSTFRLFLVVFYIWKGAGRACVVLDGNSTRCVSFFNSTLIYLFSTDIGFLQDAEWIHFPTEPDDSLLCCGTILWLCQRIVSAAIRRSYDLQIDAAAAPRSVSQALGHRFPTHPSPLSSSSSSSSSF